MSDDQWGPGDKSKWSDHGTVFVGGNGKEYPLIYGEHPHSRNDNRHYVLLREGQEPVGFSGHRYLIDLTFKSSNYLKSSELSGDDIRKAGSCNILADGVVVWEFFYRDINYALAQANHIITELSEHASSWFLKRERDQLVGRKVYYERTPAVIKRLIVDQGCVMLGTEDGSNFPRPIWDHEGDEDLENEIKTTVTDPKIWWFRST